MNAPGTDHEKALTMDGEASLMEAEITLGLLAAIDADQTVTQRSIASELGIALGLTNAYLKRCVKKGFVKVRQIPRNRYAYYLTPTGFAEKSRLSAFYLSQSLRFFRSARNECEALFDSCAAHGWTNIVLAGVGDLGEIAYYCSRERPIRLIGFLDPDLDDPFCLGLSVTPDPAILRDADAAVVTSLSDPQGAFDLAAAHMPPNRVLAPPMLKVSRHPRPLTGDEMP